LPVIFMSKAFILINVESGSEDKVVKQLKKMGLVEEAYVSYGVYDLVIKIKAETMELLKKTISEIRMVNNVRSTLSLILIDE